MRTDQLAFTLALLACSGCAGANVAAEAPGIPLSPELAPEAVVTTDAGLAIASDEDNDHYGIQGWIPEIFQDLWEIADVDIGAERGWGLHVQATNLARVGIFDYSDFGVLGLESKIFEGRWNWPVLVEDEDGNYAYDSSVWDVSAKFGLGFGGTFEIHTWQIIDFVSTLVTANYWSFDDD